IGRLTRAPIFFGGTVAAPSRSFASEGGGALRRSANSPFPSRTACPRVRSTSPYQFCPQTSELRLRPCRLSGEGELPSFAFKKRTQFWRHQTGRAPFPGLNAGAPKSHVATGHCPLLHCWTE